MSNDSLGDRMKRYEAVANVRLMQRTPVILRIDGRAFHTLTRDMTRPIDWSFVACMEQTAKALCAGVMGAQLAYVQSDEISLLLVDYRTLQTQPWFDNKLQKICSIAASIATAEFGERFRAVFPNRSRHGMFDCRAFNLPREEVVNYFVWRQQDATRNSIQSLAQAHFSHKSLLGASQVQMQDTLKKEFDINWNDCCPTQKRGFCVNKRLHPVETLGRGRVERMGWMSDSDTPIFTEDRDYIQRHVDIDLEEDE